jgi:hypothetical protein
MSKVARRAAQSHEAALHLASHLSPHLDAAASASAPASCARCVHRDESRHALEQRIAGLVVFGSGFGASVSTSRLCVLHDRLVSPGDRCGQFAPHL